MVTVILLLLTVLFSGHVAAYDWLQFGGDAQHSGNNRSETSITPSNVGGLTEKFRVPLGIAGTPVFLEAVQTPSGTKDLLYVTNSDGTLIAVDAKTGALVWLKTVDQGSCSRIDSGPCFTNTTPAIDPNRQYVYGYGLDGRVHKYRVGDGTEIISGGWPELSTLRPGIEKQSSALSIVTANGTSYLYSTVSGEIGDQGNYQGHVTAINLATGTQVVFNALCSNQAIHLQYCGVIGNGVWSRAGVTYDPVTNHILMATSNGHWDGVTQWGESLLALTPDATSLLDSYTPTYYAYLDSVDADLGSVVAAILPHGYGLQGGKDGLLRLLNLVDLSGQGGPGHLTADSQIFTYQLPDRVRSQPAVWTNPADGTTWIFVASVNHLSAFRLLYNTSNQPIHFDLQWQHEIGESSPVVANGVLFFMTTRPWYSTTQALDPITGTVLWETGTNSDWWMHSHIVVNGVLYLNTGGELVAFSLPSVNPPPSPPPPPPVAQVTVPPAASVTDAQGNSWTMCTATQYGNPILLNGSVDLANNGAGTLISYKDGQIKVQNTTGTWFLWNNGWTVTTAP